MAGRATGKAAAEEKGDYPAFECPLYLQDRTFMSGSASAATITRETLFGAKSPAQLAWLTIGFANPRKNFAI